MSGPLRGSNNCRVAFIEAETTFGTPVTQYPLAVSALRILNSSITPKSPRRAREDGFGTATKQGSVAEKETVEWSIEYAMGTPGTAATDPDWHDLLVNVLLLQQTAAVADTAVSGSGSTTTVVDVTDASNFTALKSCVTINGETRRITAVDTVSSPDNITLSPALSAAPAASDTVTSGLTYQPNDDADVTPSGATIWLANNANMWRLTGCVATSWSVAGGGTTTLRMTVTGTAQKARALFTSTIPAGVNNSDLTFTAGTGKMIPSDVSVANPYYIIASRGLAAEEFMRVTGVAGDVLTVVRGQPSGSGQTHAAGATIEPYQPAGTYAETPIPATGGDNYIAGVITRCETFGFDVDPGLLLRENVHGTSYQFYDYVIGVRSVTATAEAWTDNNPNMLRVYDAAGRTGVEVFAQQGDTTGSIVAFVCPTVYQEVPDFTYDDADQRLTLSGEAVGTTTGEDEFYLMVG